jgi:hypothetical protein
MSASQSDEERKLSIRCHLERSMISAASRTSEQTIKWRGPENFPYNPVT